MWCWLTLQMFICSFKLPWHYCSVEGQTNPHDSQFYFTELHFYTVSLLCDNVSVPDSFSAHLLPCLFSPQRPCRPWKERSGMRSSSPKLTARCRLSSSRGRPWRTPTPTLKCSRTWASLPRPWSLPMKTCESEHPVTASQLRKDLFCSKSIERLWWECFAHSKIQRIWPTYSNSSLIQTHQRWILFEFEIGLEWQNEK